MEISPDKPTEIEILSASVFYGKEKILEDLSLSITEQRVGFIGRNGSGKTTLLRILAGLQELNSGKVLIDGTEVAKKRKEAIEKVGIIFQNPDHQIIFPTVIEEMIFGLIQMGVDKTVADQRAMSYLAKFGKSEWRDRAVSTLSQGQKKLLCLMAILAMEPKVIILDEPLAALDIPTQRQLTTILQSLPQTLIYITHDTAPIQNYDVAIWLEQGQVVETGSPDTVVPRFMDEMTRIEVL